MTSVSALLKKGETAPLRRALEQDPRLAKKAQLLVEAARLAHLDALKLLQRHGADWNARWHGYRPLHALIQERPHGETGELASERRECLSFLLSHGADPEELGAFPPARALLIAAFTGLPTVVEVLIEHGAKQDVYTACALGELDRVKKLLAKDASLATARDAGGMQALHCCAASRLGAKDARIAKSLLEIARALLDAGADPGARVKSWSDEVDAAYFAINTRQRATLELLLERGASATEALSPAMWQPTFELAELVLARGAEMDRATSNGLPLLNDLVRWGQVSAALWLLERGASPSVADERGWSALHQAASRGNARLLEAILSAGADPERKDHHGLTPLAVARLSKIAHSVKKAAQEILRRRASPRRAVRSAARAKKPSKRAPRAS